MASYCAQVVYFCAFGCSSKLHRFELIWLAAQPMTETEWCSRIVPNVNKCEREAISEKVNFVYVHEQWKSTDKTLKCGLENNRFEGFLVFCFFSKVST